MATTRRIYILSKATGPILSNEHHDVMPTTQPAYYGMPPAPDEISLIDLWLILVRRKWWFVATLAVIMGAVITFLLLSRPLYESRATIQIGQIASMDGSGRPAPLEPPDALLGKLRAEYHLNNADTGTIKPPTVTDVSSGSSGKRLVTIKAHGYTPQQAHDFLQKSVQKILHGQQQRFDKAMSARKSYLASLRQQQKQFRSQVNAFRKKVEADPESNAASILASEQGALLQQISANRAVIANIQQSMTPPQSMPTDLLRQPTLPVSKASPRTLLTVVLGIMCGCLAGLFVAFGAEFFAQARAEMKRRAEA